MKMEKTTCVYSMALSTVIGLWQFAFTGLLLSACCLDSMAFMPITSFRSWAMTCGRSLDVKSFHGNTKTQKH